MTEPAVTRRRGVSIAFGLVAAVVSNIGPVYAFDDGPKVVGEVRSAPDPSDGAGPTVVVDVAELV